MHGLHVGIGDKRSDSRSRRHTVLYVFIYTLRNAVPPFCRRTRQHTPTGFGSKTDAGVGRKKIRFVHTRLTYDNRFRFAAPRPICLRFGTRVRAVDARPEPRVPADGVRGVETSTDHTDVSENQHDSPTSCGGSFDKSILDTNNKLPLIVRPPLTMGMVYRRCILALSPAGPP